MASGDTLLIFTPLMNEPPSSNAASFDLRNQHPVLDFDGTSNEEAVFSSVMPQHYAGTTGVTVYIHYATDATDQDDIDWDVSFERIGDQQQDLDVDSFAAVNSVDGTATPATSGLVDVVSVAFTDGVDMDSVATGEAFRIKITRDAASDVMTEDAQLVAIEIRET